MRRSIVLGLVAIPFLAAAVALAAPEGSNGGIPPEGPRRPRPTKPSNGYPAPDCPQPTELEGHGGEPPDGRPPVPEPTPTPVPSPAA
jgi:hypothetical protein